MALDFDRAHSLRLQFFENELEQKKLEAMKGDGELGSPHQLKPNEVPKQLSM